MFGNNGYGIRSQANGRHRVVACCFEGNDYGVCADPFTDGLGKLDVRDCWWGDQTGPSGAGTGTGDAVCANVKFAPWATTRVCEIVVDVTLPTSLPTKFVVYEPYPNPFNPSTTIKYALPEPGRLRIAVFDLKGHLIRVLVNEATAAAGIRETVWDGRDTQGRPVSSGVYVCQVTSTKYASTHRVVLIK
jgi:hypothetical protein